MAINIDAPKKETKNDVYASRIDGLFTEDSIKFLNKEKKLALDSDKDYQAMKSALKAKETEICTRVTNRIFAVKLAKEFYKNWGFDDKEQLLRLIIEDNDEIIKDGKPFAITTVSQAASYMVYLSKKLFKTVRAHLDENDKILKAFNGANELGMFTFKEITAKVLKQQKITREQLASAIQSWRRKHAVELKKGRMTK